jgi:hypothetical protein
MRRLSAIMMLLGAATAALGVFAVFGIERIDLPPSAVRFIAAAVPVVVLVTGVVLLVIGTLMARLALREGDRGPIAVTGPAHVPALGADVPGADVPGRTPSAAERRTPAGRAAGGERVSQRH